PDHRKRAHLQGIGGAHPGIQPPAATSGGTPEAQTRRAAGPCRARQRFPTPTPQPFPEPTMRQQDQFLNVVDRDEAERRFRAALNLRPLGAEAVPLAEALGRVLAADVAAPVDVPGFDRANVDGFAVRAEDTFGATEDRPRSLRPTG